MTNKNYKTGYERKSTTHFVWGCVFSYNVFNSHTKDSIHESLSCGYEYQSVVTFTSVLQGELQRRLINRIHVVKILEFWKTNNVFMNSIYVPIESRFFTTYVYVSYNKTSSGIPKDGV